MMEGFTQDVRVALRSFIRRPFFATIAVVTLALGIGAVTSVYSVAYGVLLSPLPYDAPDRIVKVGKLSEAGDRIACVISARRAASLDPVSSLRHE